MSSLIDSISMAMRALTAQQGGLSATMNNISNANTPGYSRVEPIFAENPPALEGPTAVGDGVRITAMLSLRDNILELRLNQEAQTSGQLDAYVNVMQQVEANFNNLDTNLQSAVTAFFNSFSQLAANPSSLSVRQAVITTAQSVAQVFQQNSTALVGQQTSIDRSVSQTVGDVNGLLQQIAKVNQQVSAAANTGSDAGSLQDQRTQLIRQLSGLIDVSVVQGDQNMVSLATASGQPLVVGTEAFQLTAAIDTVSGHEHVYTGTQDLTANLTAGKLGGLLTARDQDIAGILSQLDRYATQFANAVNAQHSKGYDLNGNAGVNLFAPPTATGAAQHLSVAVNDPALIAASADGTPGSTDNANAIAAIRNQGIVNGQTAAEAYANMVFGIGNAIAKAQSDQQAQQAIQQELQNQRASVSGVSIDEEATNLMKYQRAYEASARVVSTIDELLQTTLSMGAH